MPATRIPPGTTITTEPDETGSPLKRLTARLKGLELENERLRDRNSELEAGWAGMEHREREALDALETARGKVDDLNARVAEAEGEADSSRQIASTLQREADERARIDAKNAAARDQGSGVRDQGGTV